MKVEDVTDTLQLALTASGCNQARVVHKPRLLSDNVLREERRLSEGQQISIR